MNEYRPNSDAYNKSKSEEKTKKGIVKSPAKFKKKTIVDKLIDSIIPEGCTSISDYLIFDVIVPNIKRIVVDTVTSIFGEGTREHSKSSYISYGKNYDRASRREREDSRTSSRIDRIYDYENIRYDTYYDANAVLEKMYDIIEEYQKVTIWDLYDVSDISTDNFELGKYGWTSLKNANIVRYNNNTYGIKFPKAMRIK